MPSWGCGGFGVGRQRGGVGYNDGGVDGDDDVMMRVAAAAETGGGGERRVEESGCGDRIDPVMRNVLISHPYTRESKVVMEPSKSRADLIWLLCTGTVVDLQTQLQHFSDVENLYRQSLGDTIAEQLLSNVVYLFSCGANDYISHVPNCISISSIYPTLTNKQYTELVIGNLASGIYEKGGRKFGFLTVPLIGCFPALQIGQLGNTYNKD
ncbi:hypothetical protein Tco_0608197 [Tanacetum coccineum]